MTAIAIAWLAFSIYSAGEKIADAIRSLKGQP